MTKFDIEEMLIVLFRKKVFVMNKLTVRLLSALLALLTALSVMGSTAFAAQPDAEAETAAVEPGDVPESELAETGAATETADLGEKPETAPTGVDYAALEKITKIEGASDGVQLSWTKDAGVSKMAIYRKNGAQWERIAESAGNSYLDKNVTSGTDYTYTLRALRQDGSFAHDTFDTVGVTLRWLKTPTVRVENAPNGVKVSWDAISGAYQYRVYYRNSRGGWTRLTDTGETSFIDTDVASNVIYTYTVRCLNADGTAFSSFFDTAGKAVRYIAAPVLVSANGEDDGIRISWKASPGASKYRVFYRNSRGGWSVLSDTTATSVLDRDVRAGVVYTYTVRCMDASGYYNSSFYPEGISGSYAKCPVFTVSNGTDGVEIKWNAVEGAAKYRVYYYGSRGWTKLTETTGTSVTDTDVSSGVTYTYTVRCVNADSTAFTSGFLPGKKVTFYAAPVVSVSNAADGVRISWNAVNGVQKYRVFYYGVNGWTRMADTASTSYLDKQVTSGHSYIYTVRGLNASGTEFLGWFRDGVRIKYVAAPVLKTAHNDKSVTVSWDKVDGAAKYRVYQDTPNGWTRITDTANTYYEDKNVTSGGTYTYTVRCLNADGSFASFFRGGKSIKYVEKPQITGVENTTRGVKISWNGSKGAEKYRVYYKNGGSWTRIGETTGTSFEHTGAASGTTYTYTVRCINNALTEFQSTFDTVGKSIRYIASPKNIRAEVVNNSIKISWTHSAGAEKYRVYYYGSKGWTRLAETTSNSVIDTVISSGYTYRYTVRCINASGTAFTSDCDTTGVYCKFTSMPVLNPLDFTQDGVKISWKASPGTEKYRVYYYGSRGWTRLAETTGTSVIDTDVSSGYTYRYTVRCITSDGTKFTSDCDTTGVKGMFCTAPKLVSTLTDTGRISFSWTRPRGAEKFRAYKLVNGQWTRLGDTTSNYITDRNVSVGSTYTYTVRVITPDSTAFCSGFDPSGFIITVVTGVKGFVYYDQTKYDYPYGDNAIADSGCGPTSFAMVASTLTGRSITPIDAVKWCGNSFYLMGAGTYWSYFPAAADQFGITLQNEYGAYEIDSVISELKKGRFVISSQGPGRFTKGGHFIVLAGVTSDGKIIVYDPNGANHYVGTAFSPSEITDAGTHYWSFSK